MTIEGIHTWDPDQGQKNGAGAGGNRKIGDGTFEQITIDKENQDR